MCNWTRSTGRENRNAGCDKRVMMREGSDGMPEIIGATYEIIKKIGSGGGGNVFLANHLRLGKKVVLKADKRKITARPELLRREVDTLKDLSHSYIPQVYDFFVEEDTVYTVMDYIEGESLDRPLKRGEKFPQPQVIKWSRQLLEALCYLHSPTHGNPPRGFVHSDIKPANLMRTRDGNICLIDFNIALALGEENVVGCSAGYASPEHYGLDFSMVGGMTGTRTETMNEAGDSRHMGTRAEPDTETALDTDTETMLDTDTETVYSDMGTMADTGNIETDSQPNPRLSNVSFGVPPRKVANSSSNMSSDFGSGISRSSGSSMKKIVPDVRSDIYSVGATLYHLLCGRRPARHAMEVASLSEKEFSPQIVKIISKAMHPNPDLRYQTAGEMLEAFSRLHENDTRMRRFKRTNRIAYTAIGACFALGVLSSFVGLKRIQVVESRLKLIEYSQNALAKGDKQEAVRLALETVPEKDGPLTPACLPQSQRALADALGVYDLADGFKKYKAVELPSNPLMMRIAPDGKTAACIYEGFVAVIDTETAKIVATFSAETSALAEVRYLNNERIVYAGRDGIAVYDIVKGGEVWSGRPATAIAVSKDGKTVAAIYKGETFATVYDADTGQELGSVDFQGKSQNVAENDGFANPNNNLLALSEDGTLLAVSFRDGTLRIYDVGRLRNAGSREAGAGADSSVSGVQVPGTVLEILDETSGYTNFDGGFYGKYFAFSAGVNRAAARENASDLSGTESGIKSPEADSGQSQTASEAGSEAHTNPSATAALESGSEPQASANATKCIVVVIDTDVKTQVGGFASDGYCKVATDANGIYLQRNNVLVKMDVLTGEQTPLVDMTGDIRSFHTDGLHTVAVTADKLLCFDENAKSEGSFEEDGSGEFVQTANGVAVSGSLNSPVIKILRYESRAETEVFRYDASYEHAEARVSADEKTVMLFSYRGFRICEVDGAVVAEVEMPDAGQIYDQQYVRDGDGERLEVTYSDGTMLVYDGQTGEMVSESPGEKPQMDADEEYFTQAYRIVAPLHGTPTVYDRESGKPVCELEKDAYLTYVTEVGDYIVTQYAATDGSYYGILLNGNCEVLAKLPYLSDVIGAELYFDYPGGYVRKTHVYNMEELMAKCS